MVNEKVSVNEVAVYRILVIPGARDGLGGVLNLDTEIMLLANISNQFDSIAVDLVLPDDATELKITQKLTLGNIDYDAVHWLGHADDNGFYLSEHEQLSQERMQRVCNDAGARTTFLNSCESARIGQYLVNNKMAVALCYSAPVLDRDGILNALRFYSALAKSNDPFQDGLREAYTAADPGDGTLLWLTNGQYVKEIISPIIDRLDMMDGRHTSSFGSFTSSLKTLDERLSQQVQKLSSSTKHTRYTLITLLTVILICSMSLIWAASSFASGLAQTASSSSIAATGTVTEPGLTATWTSIGETIPPKNTHGATPQKPTKKPKLTATWTPLFTPHVTRTVAPKSTITPSSPTGTATPIIVTQRPTARPTASNTSRPTSVQPTATLVPTVTPRQTVVPATTAPSATAWPIITLTPPSATQRPTGAATMETKTPPVNTKIPPSATMTEFEKAVDEAVKATIAKWSGCTCGQ